MEKRFAPDTGAAGFRVLAAFALFVLFRSLDKVFHKRVSDRMQNYSAIYANILFPVGALLVNTILAFGWVAYHRSRRDARYDMGFFSYRSKLASRAGAYPQSTFALFSLLGTPPTSTHS